MSWRELERGYPQLSALIAADEDKSTTIYRRFERLAARNLLYLESELTKLEAEQDRLDEESREDGDKVAAEWDLQEIGTVAAELNSQSKGEQGKKLPPVSEGTEETEHLRNTSSTEANPGSDDEIRPAPVNVTMSEKDIALKRKLNARLRVAAAIRTALREYCKYGE